MAQSCQEMTQRLKSSRAETEDLIGKTTTLQTQSSRVDVQRAVLDTFLSRYQLTEAETNALSGKTEMNEEFFNALDRVRDIHENCKSLLRSNQQQAGLSVMESMAALQEVAFEHLFRWTQGVCVCVEIESVGACMFVCLFVVCLFVCL